VVSSGEAAYKLLYSIYFTIYPHDAMLAQTLAVVTCLCVSVTCWYCIIMAVRIKLIFYTKVSL